MRQILNGTVAVMSMGAFLLGLYLAYLSQVAAAGICIVAAVLPVLFSQLPFVEYLKVLGLEAKLRERVNEADTIVGSLKRIASVSAEQLFTQAALGGRWGGETLSSKRDRATRLTAMLQELNVSQAEIASAKTAYLRAIAHDLAYVFFSVIRNLVQAKKKTLTSEREGLFGKSPIDMRDPKGVRWNELLAEERRLEAQIKWPENSIEDASVENLRAFCMAFIDGTDTLTKDERSRLTSIANEVDALFRASQAAGNYTAETVAYLEKYGPTASYLNNQNLRFAEAFPEVCRGH